MQITTKNPEQISFSVYPHFLFLLIQLFFLGMLAYLFIYSSLLFKLFEGAVFIICFIELFVQYMLPLHIKIDKTAKLLWFRDISIAPSFLIKDDSKDEIASTNPFKHFSIEKLTRMTFTTDMPELATRMWNLFPINKHIGGKFSFILMDNERIDIYVGIWDLYRHKKAFKKTASYLGIPFE